MTAGSAWSWNDWQPSELLEAARCPCCGQEVPRAPSLSPGPSPAAAAVTTERPCPSCGTALAPEGGCPRCGGTRSVDDLPPGLGAAVHAILASARSRLGSGLMRLGPQGLRYCPSCLGHPDGRHASGCELASAARFLDELRQALEPSTAESAVPAAFRCPLTADLLRRGRAAIGDGFLWSGPGGRFCLDCAGSEPERCHGAACEIAAAAQLVEELERAVGREARAPGATTS